MHVGSVMVFQPPKEGFDYDRFVAVVGDRIAGHARYRQRIESTKSVHHGVIVARPHGSGTSSDL